MSFAPSRFALAFCLLTTGTLAAQHLWTFAFEEDRTDQPPVGFSLVATRQADAGRWIVQRSGGSGHLVHRADTTASGFALAVADRPAPSDAAVSVRLRFSGATRSGGLVWHYRDDLNYNALLLDLNRGELSVYRVTAGNRVRLDMRDELELDPAAWHALKVIHEGNDIRVMLGGVRVFDEQDRRASRPDSESRVGVLASGASEIWFDDLSVDAKRGHR